MKLSNSYRHPCRQFGGDVEIQTFSHRLFPSMRQMVGASSFKLFRVNLNMGQARLSALGNKAFKYVSSASWRHRTHAVHAPLN